MKYKYIVLGSNNFWYSLDDTIKEAKATIKNAKENPNDYANDETGEIPNEPNEFYIYKAIEITK